MLRKTNTKLLSGILVALGIIFAILKITEPAGVGNMPTYLTNFDPAECHEISISGAKDQASGILLQRKNTGWMIKDMARQKEYKADSSRVNQLLDAFCELKPLRLASQSEERWEDFSVTDSTATHIIFKGEDEKLADLMLGRFTYTQSPMAAQMQQQNPYMRQNPGTMSTYLRHKDEKEVYAVEGFLSSQAAAEVSAFRDKSFLTLKGSTTPLRMDFKYPSDSSFVLQKKENKWWIDNLQADSVSVAKYLNGLRNLKLRSFAKKSPQQETHALSIEVLNGMTINVNAELKNEKAILSSDQYPDNLAGDNNKYLFDKLFWSKEKFLDK